MSYTETGLTAGKRDIDFPGRNRKVTTEITIDSYTEGGESFDPALEMGIARTGTVIAQVADGSARFASYDYENQTILVYTVSDGLEVAADTGDIPIRLEVTGRGG